MCFRLLRSFFGLMTAVSVLLVLRDFMADGPIVAACGSLLAGGGALFWSTRKNAPMRQLGLGLFISMSVLITYAAHLRGGAMGASLAFSFIPGFLAILIFGRRWGWGICLLNLSGMGLLFISTPSMAAQDTHRFVNEVAITLYATALSHGLLHSLEYYERALLRRWHDLLLVRETRQELAKNVYRDLEPLSAQLIDTLDRNPSPERKQEIEGGLEEMIGHLKRSKALAAGFETGESLKENPDPLIRCRAMRAWLLLACGMMAFLALRNYLVGTPFVAPLLSLCCALLFYFWLGSRAAASRLEWTAFAIGLSATGPMFIQLLQVGATPDAPPLVITPSTMMFTTLLSQGTATTAIFILELITLGWVGIGKELTQFQFLLLGNLLISFVVVIIAMRSVLSLRHHYVELLTKQQARLSTALSQHRQFSATLFHDVNNHLQILTLHLDCDEPKLTEQARSLGRRIQRLIAVSKEVLLDSQSKANPHLIPVRIADAAESITEAYGLHMRSKGQHFVIRSGMELEALALPELLFESVLGNLVSNAIKFSPPASAITLEAELIGSEVRIVLSDCGPRIPDEVLEQLGRIGAVPSRPGTAGEPGQGFGLQLVREHLQRMQGRVEFTRREEGGTKAVIWLKSATANEKKRA